MNKHIDYLGNIGIVVADWNIESSFKPRTITTDYNTWITYISRKGVPAGIEITNTEYWKPIARIDPELVQSFNDFKAQVIAEMKAFEDSITADYDAIAETLFNNVKDYLDDTLSNYTVADPSKIDSLFP